ncbi:MAG: competence/damage-inducible protein A [Verrucomicrobia bacterium]|nr:competence/damage-inducible protein A [Verrucomicrobiota bacterium]
MRIELINTGSELMLGRVVNTHQAWICRQLADRGCPVRRQVTVDDSAPAIVEAVRDALGAADLVVVTGGLGPTRDDRTRDLIAALLGRPLLEDPSVWQHIQDLMARRGRPVLERMRLQARVPAGARVLPNAHGTAPGLLLRVEPNAFRPGGGRSLLALLPGPARELVPMFLEQLVPILRNDLPLRPDFFCRTLRTTGLGESQIEDMIAGPLREQCAAGLDLAYCARVGEVDVRLSATGPAASEHVRLAETLVCRLLGDRVFGFDEDTLEGVVVRRLAARHLTVALAESCTGGFIAHRLTNIPGASAVFPGGAVTYSNDAKQSMCGVPSATLAGQGAVSPQTASAMAAGVRTLLGADMALGVTGIAGPGGGSEAKPVGTVYIGLATGEGVMARQFFNPVDRETFKWVTSQQALDMLRHALDAPAPGEAAPGRP